MKRRTPDIGERLFDRVWKRVGKSRALWDQYCAEQQARQMSFAQLMTALVKAVVVLSLILAYPFGFIPLVYTAQGANGLLAVQSIATMTGTFYLANLLASSLQCSRMVTVFSHLPATDRYTAWFIYKRQHWPLAVVFYLQICIYGFLANVEPADQPHWGLAPLAAASQVVIYAATATILLRYVPRGVLGWRALRFLPYFVFAFAFSTLKIPPTAVTALLGMSPSGWLNMIVLWAAVPNGLMFLWLLLPIFAWCAWACLCLMEIMARYRVRQFYVRTGQEMEIELTSSPRMDAEIDHSLLDDFAREQAWAAAERNAAAVAQKFREQIRNRQFVESDDWSDRGWIEWLGYHCLNERERLLVEALSSNMISWSPGWYLFAIASVVAWGVTWFFQLGHLVWAVEAFIGFAYLASGFWPAFRLRSCGGTYISQIYSIPIGLDETFSALMKVALLRICTASVVWFPLIAVTTINAGQGVEFGVAIGILTIVLALSISIWTAYFLFGMGAEFSLAERRFLWFIGLVILTVVSIGGTIFAINGISQNALADGIRQMGSGLSIVMTATSLNWLIFRTIYRNGAIDLVVFEPPYSQEQLAGRELQEINAGRRIEQRQQRGGSFWRSRPSSSSVEST